MVRDYVQQLYEPTAVSTVVESANGWKRARELAAWKHRVSAAWNGVRVDAVETDASVADLGTTRTVEAVVSLGELTPDDVEVQLVHGPVGQGDEIERPERLAMTQLGPTDDHRRRYRGDFVCAHAGRYGFTVRVVPSHAALVTPVELGRIAWA
jgi:starch phosphorylase